MRSAILAGLAGCCGLLAACIAYEIAVPPPPVADPQPLPKASSVHLPDAIVFAPRPIAFYHDIDERPLFVTDRKPLLDEGDGAPAATSDISVVGVSIDGTRAIALLKNKSDNTTTTASVGDIVGGWRISKILPDKVVIRANGSDTVVALNGPSSDPPSAPLAAAVDLRPRAPAPASSAAGGSSPRSTVDVVAHTDAASPATPARPAVVGTETHPAPHKVDPTISPNAKGYTYDPQTGEPVL